MSNKPTHTAYVIIDPKEGSDHKAQWIEVGAVWPHKNGQGFWFRCGSKKIPQSCREMPSAKPNQRVRRGWLRPS